MFETILSELVRAVPGARGAIFCDREGETIVSVGASGRDEPEAEDDYDLRITGAQLAPNLAEVSNAPFGPPEELRIRGSREHLLVRTLPEGYYLVLCLAPATVVSRASYHLRRAGRQVLSEM